MNIMKPHNRMTWIARLATRLTIRPLCAAACIGIPTMLDAALVQVTDRIGGDFWDDPFSWAPIGVPNNGANTYSVTLDSAHIVLYDYSTSVDSVVVKNDGELFIESNGVLSVSSGIHVEDVQLGMEFGTINGDVTVTNGVYQGARLGCVGSAINGNLTFNGGDGGYLRCYASTVGGNATFSGICYLDIDDTQIAGDLALSTTESSEITMRVSSTQVTTPLLDVSGAVALAGDLYLGWYPTLDPLDPAATYTLIRGGSLSGSFSNAADGARIRAVGVIYGSVRINYSPASKAVTVSDYYPPLKDWKFQEIGDANAPDLGDFDFDGISNLVEYALVLNPTQPSNASMPAAQLRTYAEGKRLALVFNRDRTRVDAAIEVQAAGSASGPWTTVATSTMGAAFTGPGFVVAEPGGFFIETIEVRDTVNFADAPARFLRVKVTH